VKRRPSGIYRICCRISGVSIFPHLYQKKAQTCLTAAMT
jgi:hypothetical protein